jgi:hypothetical protein
MLVDPALKTLFENGKVDHPPDIVGLIALDVELGRIVVTVKEFAFAAVPVQPMPGTELDAAHDRQGHG